jgi:hypothetical protein
MLKTSQLGAVPLELGASRLLAGAGSTAGRSRLQAGSVGAPNSQRLERELGQRWPAAAEAPNRGGGADDSWPPVGLQKLQEARATPWQGRGEAGGRRRISTEWVAAGL